MMPRRRPSQDYGFTLVEMLVVMMLLAIVGSIIMSITITSMKTAAKQEDQTRTLSASKVALERVTREIRSANSMTVSQPREVAFVTRADGVRRETRIFVREVGAATELVQSESTSDLTTGAAIGTSEQIVLGGLAHGSSEAVFRYYAGDYYGENDPQTVELLPAAPGDVRTVGVRVRLHRGYGASPIELYQLVSIRNLED